MPEVTIEIGGRSFVVACQAGEEPFLNAAAAMLDTEAQALLSSGARLAQDRMLLMAGLMLADKAISADDELGAMETRLASQAAIIDELQDRPAPAPERVEVVTEVIKEVVPDTAVNALEAAVIRAEALANDLEKDAASEG